jgi:hypothetical protein
MKNHLFLFFASLVYIHVHRDRERIVVGFTTTCAMSAHHH